MVDSIISCKQCNTLTTNNVFCSRTCTNQWQRENRKGINGGFYGKHHSEKIKELIRQKAKERRRKLGYINSPETRLKISIGKKGKTSFRKGLSQIEEYGKERAKVLREQNRIKGLGHKVSKETREKMSLARKDYRHSEETKRKIGLGHLGKKISDRHKEALRKSMYIRMQEGKYKNCDTDIERMMENCLLFNNILYVKQYNYGMGVADFYLPESNVVIECDGSYWHSLLGRKELDTKKDSFLESNDYIVLRFSDKEIKENIDWCLKSIQSLL